MAEGALEEAREDIVSWVPPEGSLWVDASCVDESLQAGGAFLGERVGVKLAADGSGEGVDGEEEGEGILGGGRGGTGLFARIRFPVDFLVARVGLTGLVEGVFSLIRG